MAPLTPSLDHLHNHYGTDIVASPGCSGMEFRDGPSLAKGLISLPDLGWHTTSSPLTPDTGG